MTLKPAHVAATNFSISFFIAITEHFSRGQTHLAILSQSWRTGATQSWGRMFRVIVVHCQSRILPWGSMPPGGFSVHWSIGGSIKVALVNASNAIYTDLVPTVCRCALTPTAAGTPSISRMASAMANSMDGQSVSRVRLYGGPTPFIYIGASTYFRNA
jgi:hypothetical protein